VHARRTLAVAATLIAAAGCNVGPTHGELGNALFSYDKGAFGCLVGCPSASEPMAANSRVIIYVTNADDLAEFTVSSTDESIATFARSGTAKVNGKTWIGVSAVSHGAGDVKLALTETGGGELDRLPVRVHDVAKIEVHDRMEEYRDALTVQAGGGVTLLMDLKDARGEELVGHGGINYTYQGAANEPALLQVLFGELITSIFAGTAPEYLEVSTEGPGSGTITASSPGGATLDIPVKVIDGDSVTSVTLEGEGNTATVGESYFVNAKATAGTEQVHAPKCFWTLSDVVGPVTIKSAGRDYASLESAEAGSATLSCTVGAQANASMMVVFK
jgi:hypothetical protein